MAQTSIDKKTASINLAAQMATRAERSTMLVLLSNAGGNLAQIFTSQHEAFQCLTFVFNGIGALATAVKLAMAPNKNIGKTQNLAVAIAKFAIAGAILFGSAVMAPAAATALFFSLLAVDTVIATGKAIYFGVKALTTKSEEEKTFFKEKAKQMAIGAGLGAITIAAFGITMAIGHSIAVAAGILGGVIGGSAVLYSIGLAIHQTFFKKKASETSQEKSEQENDNNVDLVEKKEKRLTAEAAPELNQTQEEKHSSYAKLGVLGKFFANSVTLKKTPLEIKEAINKHINKIFEDESKDKANGSLWTQTEKRGNKIHALLFLKALVGIQQDSINESGKLEIAGHHSFEYNNKEDLIAQIDRYVIKEYPDVYQSFFKDIGKVEDLFKQAYQAIRDAPEKPPVVTPPVDEGNKNTLAAAPEEANTESPSP